MFWVAFSAIVNCLLALATFGIIIVNVRQVNASKQQAQASEEQADSMRKQVKVSEDQVRATRAQLEQSQKQMQETLEAGQRPFLYPAIPLSLSEGHDGPYFDFEQLDPSGDTVGMEMYSLKLKNVGAGIALNIRAIVAEPHPKTAEIMHLPPGALMAPDETTRRAPRLRSVILDTALPPGDEVMESHLGGPFVIGWDTLLDSDPRNTLTAPASPTTEHPYHIVARLTIFQDDIFGHTYASQFDFNDRGRWMFHWSGRVPPGSEALKRLKLKP